MGLISRFALKVLKLPEHETAFASGQLYGPSVHGNAMTLSEVTRRSRFRHSPTVPRQVTPDRVIALHASVPDWD
jgi:hypothetical protein